MINKLDTVRKLLAKAERAATPQEAEAYSIKAQELMIRYSIDAAEIDATSERREAVTTRRIVLDGYALAKAQVLAAVARNLSCDIVVSTSRRPGGKTTRVAVVHGHPADLEAFDLLATSLLLQATTAGTAAHKLTPWVHGKTFRHNFLLGFAARVNQRMSAAREAAVSEVSTSTAVALVDRSAAVKAHVADTYGKLHKTSSTLTDGESYRAGDEAGRRARLSSPTELGGGR